MNRQKFIKDKAEWLFDQVAVDGDELDLHLIETTLDEVFEAGIEEAKKEEGQ